MKFNQTTVPVGIRKVAQVLQTTHGSKPKVTLTEEVCPQLWPFTDIAINAEKATHWSFPGMLTESLTTARSCIDIDVAGVPTCCPHLGTPKANAPPTRQILPYV